MQSVHTLLKLAQLRCTGYVTRMPDKRLPKKILYGELQVGKRSHDGQKKRYKDTLKASLKDLNIPTESWEQIAQDRTKWRGLIRRGAGEYEAKRISKAEQQRAQRKARAKASPTELYSSDLSFYASALDDAGGIWFLGFPYVRTNVRPSVRMYVRTYIRT